MPRLLLITRAITFLSVLVMLPADIGAQNPQPFKDWKNSSLSDSLIAAPRMACESVVSMTGYEFSILSATSVAASGPLPQFCRILGQILPEVRFELSLPASWNGRLYMFGNGGYAGEPLDAPGRAMIRHDALQRGFAVVQTNTGHDAALEPLGTFAADQQKLIDYAFRAVHVTAITAKRLAQTYYETPVRRSYFNGCSTGGRQGLMSAQRFPEDFDGVLVGAPVLDFASTQMSGIWNAKALASGPLGADHLKVIADIAYGKCDASDGVRDGVIDDPRSCTFAPATDLPRCSAEGASNTCFTNAQTGALEAIYRGPSGANGSIAPGWPVGAEVASPRGSDASGPASSGWAGWFVPSQPAAPSQQLAYGESFMRYMAFGKADPRYDWREFDFDSDPQRMGDIRRILDATDPDLSRFSSHGGKILMYFGWADPALNPLMGVQYYEQLTTTMGQASQDFFKLYMVPGMFHCGNGVATASFDAFTPLVEWVEKGTAPSAITAARVQDRKVVRTRPLCPYPQVARYRGTGSTDSAENFSCVDPDAR